MPLPASKLFLPHQVLAGCVFAAVYRDTRGVEFSDRDRVSHFPASPLVSVTCVFHGKLILLQTPSYTGGTVQGEATPPCFVMGPTDAPISSWSPGEVTAITIGLYHDAWLLLGGDPEFQNVPENLKNAFARFAEANEIETGWNALCAELGSVWDEQRPRGWRSAWGIADWTQATLTRAMMADAGRSLRSLERRLKRMSGQTRRSLDFYSAIENLQLLVNQNPDTPLAEVALTAGYSDQSHMGRAVRRATGFTPAKLNNAIKTEESFWCYRLLGERF